MALVISYFVLSTNIYSADISSAYDGLDNHPFYDVSCNYDNTSKKLRFEFRMKSEDVRKYEGAKIALYALNPPFSIDSLAKLKPLVNNISPSTRTTTEIKIKNISDRLCSYVYVLQNNGNNICSALMRPKINYVKCNFGFKGAESNSEGKLIETISDTALIDINVDIIESNSGYMFQYDDKTYTFNTSYLDSIDNKINLIKKTCRCIIIRLYSETGINAIFENTVTANETVYAYVRFLCSRYMNSAYDGLSGIVLGDGNIVNYVSSAGYAGALFSAATAINDINARCSLIMPISEKASDGLNFIESVIENGGSSFTVMLESESLPRNINNNTVENVEKQDSFIDVSLLLSSLNKFSGSGVSSKIIYNWKPNKELDKQSVKAAYIYNYYALFNDNNVESFIASLDENPSSDLDEAVRYINTSLCNSFLNPNDQLDRLGVDSWDKIYEGFSFYDTQTFDLSEKGFIIGEQGTITGKMEYFDFSTTAAVSKWKAGESCTGIITNKKNDERFLMANVHFGGTYSSENAFILYEYDQPESFKYSKMLSFKFMIESDVSGGNYKFYVDIGGNNFLYNYYSENFVANKPATVRIDVSNMDEKSSVNYIRIGIKSNSTTLENANLNIYSICAESDSLSSEELRKQIESERFLLGSTIDGSNIISSRINKTVVVIIAFVVVCTIAVMFMISKKHKFK